MTTQGAEHTHANRDILSKIIATLNIHISYILSLTKHPPSTNPAEIQVYDYCSALAQLMTEYEKSLQYFFYMFNSFIYMIN